MFGTYLRKLREEREISLREMAKSMSISPAYLSRVERNDFPPLTAQRCVRAAEILCSDPDELIIAAGRIPDDVRDIIRCNPGLVKVIRELAT